MKGKDWKIKVCKCVRWLVHVIEFSYDIRQHLLPIAPFTCSLPFLHEILIIKSVALKLSWI